MSNQKLENWAIGVTLVTLVIIVIAVAFLYYEQKAAVRRANEVTPITDPIMRDFVNKMMEGTTTNR